MKTKRFFLFLTVFIIYGLCSCNPDNWPEAGSAEDPVQNPPDTPSVIDVLAGMEPVLVRDGVYRYSGIVYGDYQGTDGSNTFNLYVPADYRNRDKKPAVFYVHGGSWNSGTADEYERYFEAGDEKYAFSYVEEYGLPVISVDYRHVGESKDGKRLTAYTDYSALGGFISGTKETALDYYFFEDNGNRIIDLVEDIATCVRFVSENADSLWVDTSFAIMDGYSAGANLELLYVFSDSVEKSIPVRAVIDRCGPADMSSGEYIKFFSDLLVHGTYKSTVDTILGSADVDLTMKTGDNDGEHFLTGMIAASTDLNPSFDELKTMSENGLELAPEAVKEISPAYTAGLCSEDSLPYIVMAYGQDVDLDIGVNSNFDADANLSGDPLAPRKGGELLARKLDRKSILQYGSDGRIANNCGTYAFYRGDWSRGERLAFLGSSVGGHAICSKDEDESFSKHWLNEELEDLENAVRYAVEEVCGLTRCQ